MLKLIDLVETVVFVLRKKQEQISFLHVYHHVSTILLMWFMTKYYAVTMASFGILINCAVHVIMYTYYYLSTLGPNMQKILSPYKPIITSVQMVSVSLFNNWNPFISIFSLIAFRSNSLFAHCTRCKHILRPALYRRCQLTPRSSSLSWISYFSTIFIGRITRNRSKRNNERHASNERFQTVGHWEYDGNYSMKLPIKFRYVSYLSIIWV